MCQSVVVIVQRYQGTPYLCSSVNTKLEAMKKRILKALTLFLLSISLHFVAAPQAQAQCPMCKMSAESNLKDGGSAAKGLNNGILFMLSTPYIIVGVLGYIWWRNRKKEEEEEVLNS